MVTARENCLKNQGGRASVIALLASCAILYYVKTGYHYFGEGLHPAIYWGVISSLAVLTVFSIGCAMHLKFIGGRSNGEVHRELQIRTRNLEGVILSAQKRINEYEKVMLNHTNVMSRKGVDCLALAKKLIAALESRLDEVRGLVARRNEIDFIDAHELLRRKLYVVENCYESLIDSDPIPPLEPYQWEPALNRLLAEVGSEIRQLLAA